MVNSHTHREYYTLLVHTQAAAGSVCCAAGAPNSTGSGAGSLVEGSAGVSPVPSGFSAPEPPGAPALPVLPGGEFDQVNEVQQD